MKKIISLLLILALIAAIPCISAAGADDASLKVAVATDLHLQTTEQYGSLSGHNNIPGSQLYAHATMQGQMEAESRAIFRSFLKNFSDSEEEILLLCGDMCGGLKTTHLAIARELKMVENETGKRIFVVPGNHDIDTDNDAKPTVDEFAEIYADFGYNEAISRDESSASYTVDLNEQYRLICIDSCIYGEDDGHITREVWKYIKEEAQKARSDGKYLIAMMHHNLLPHFYLQPNLVENDTCTVGVFSSLADELADMGIKYVFTGHLHANDITMSVSRNGNTVCDILTGSLITYPNAYRNIDFSESGVTVNTAYINSIDENDLPDGFSDAQLEVIQNDFNGYAEGFFESGMIMWINRYLGCGDKLAGKLRLKKDTALYNAFDRLMTIVGNSLRLPIYDNGEGCASVEAIAASAGAQIPANGYEYPYQVIGAIGSAFYSGSGALGENSPEAELTFAVIKSALAYALGEIKTELSAEEYNAFITVCCGASDSELTGKRIANAARLTWADTLLKRFIGCAATPLLNSVTDDAYYPEDLNVTLDAYSQTSEKPSGTAPTGLFARILEYLRAVLMTVFAVFR